MIFALAQKSGYLYARSECFSAINEDRSVASICVCVCVLVLEYAGHCLRLRRDWSSERENNKSEKGNWPTARWYPRLMFGQCCSSRCYRCCCWRAVPPLSIVLFSPLFSRTMHTIFPCVRLAFEPTPFDRTQCRCVHVGALHSIRMFEQKNVHQKTWLILINMAAHARTMHSPLKRMKISWAIPFTSIRRA